MKVRVTKHSSEGTIMRWWYADHIGEEFEVEDDPVRSKYYYTNVEGSPYKHHILKDDCEIVESNRGYMLKGIFEESGWLAEVNILEDKSDEEWERYSLEVIETIHESPIFKTPENGHTFEASAKRKYRAYIDWKLTVKE